MAARESRQAMVNLDANASIRPFLARGPETKPTEDEVNHIGSVTPETGEYSNKRQRTLSPFRQTVAVVVPRILSPNRPVSSTPETATGQADAVDQDVGGRKTSPAPPEPVVPTESIGPTQSVVLEAADEPKPQTNAPLRRNVRRDTSPQALRLDGKGRLGSLAASTVQSKITESEKRTRKKPKLVSISYGRKDLQQRISLGQKINQILASSEVANHVKETAQQAQAAPVHPFFNNKKRVVKEQAQPADKTSRERQPCSRIRSMINPNYRAKNASAHESNSDENVQPRFNRGPPRIPGTQEALWPPRSMVHIGHPLSERKHLYKDSPSWMRARRDKSKSQTYNGAISSTLANVEFVQTGYTLARTTQPQRRVLSTTKVYDQCQAAVSSTGHPAVSRLLETLASTIGPFDRGESESLSWCQKYSPKTTEQVLGNERELAALKMWLHGQKVDAVASDAGSSKQAALKHRRKRRRIKDKLDDFIVSDDEEPTEMRGLHDASDSDELQSLIPRSTESMIGGGSSGSKQSNIIILSGGPGTGKSAAVFAVAKELDFTVFEINAGSRRSGKDLCDKVGDLARNHQVHNNSSATPVIEGTVKSFFDRASKQPVRNDATANAKKAVKSQKQALILLEEVDVLFDEDRQFWETLVSLADQSRRPIILTCNDESVIPMSEFQPYGILRFRAPPVELVADYLTLITAAEGHLISSDDIRQLYRQCKGDLRSTLQNLNFWCQMAIGDTKGGMDWMLPGWPRGKHVDAQGQPLRVMSQGTFHCNLVGVPLHTMNEQTLDEDRATELRRLAHEADLASSADLFSTGADQGHSPRIPLDPTQPALSGTGRLQYIEAYQFLDAAEDEHKINICNNYTTALASTVHNQAPKNPTRRKPVWDMLPASTPFSTSQSALDLDYLPCLRSIAAFDLALEQFRAESTAALTMGKVRTTRAARSAFEGGNRQTTRRTRWFDASLDLAAILETGGKGWNAGKEYRLGCSDVGSESEPPASDPLKSGPLASGPPASDPLTSGPLASQPLASQHPADESPTDEPVAGSMESVETASCI